MHGYNYQGETRKRSPHLQRVLVRLDAFERANGKVPAARPFNRVNGKAAVLQLCVIGDRSEIKKSKWGRDICWRFLAINGTSITPVGE